MTAALAARSGGDRRVERAIRPRPVVAFNGAADAATVVGFPVLVLALTPLLTWVYNRTGRLWAAMVTHPGINASHSLVPAASVSPMTVGVVAFGVIAVVLLIATRGRLGDATPVGAAR